MAIAINYIRPWTQLISTAGQTVFSTIWTADVASDILVYARDEGTEARDVVQLVPSSEYTVAFIGAGRTVQVTFLSGRTLNEVITITRDTPADRNNLYTNNNFTPTMLNGDFFRLVLMIQQSVFYDKDLAPRYNTSETLYDVDRIIDLYLPKLPPKHVWRKNAENTRIEAFLLEGGSGGDGTPAIWEFPQSVDTSGVYQGAAVRFDTGLGYYVPALGDSRQNANVVAIVRRVLDDATIELQQSGWNNVSYSGLNTGDYFLSTTVPGGITQSEPQNDDEVSVPIIAMQSSDTGVVRNFRGKVIGEDSDDGPATGNGRNRVIVAQAGHGFSRNDQLYVKTDSTYELADATDPIKTEVAGTVVDEDPFGDGDYFTLQTEGYTSDLTGSPALTPGALHYLNPASPGKLTTTKPTNPIHYIRPCVLGITATHGFILQRWPLQDAEGANSRTIDNGSPHGFSAGEYVRPDTANAGKYVYAQADTLDNARDVWQVTATTTNTYTIQQTGYSVTCLDIGQTHGQTVYLDPTTPGAATLTQPTAIGSVSKPLFTSLGTGTTNGDLLNSRPMLQPGANGGSGTGKDLILSFDASVTPELQFDFPNVFKNNTGYKRFRLEWDDMYNDDLVLGGYVVKVEVYIGAVLQTTGYTSSETTRDFGYSDVFTGQTSVTYIPITGEPTTGGCYNSLPLAHSGVLDFLSPLTNGSSKVMRGRFDGYGNINTHRLSGNIIGCMIGNTSRLDGFKISIVSGGSTKLYGRYRLYGISE